MDKRVAIVTGANRGIGFEVCRLLAAKSIHVVLTARNPIKGRLATSRLQKRGLDVEFCTLDVTAAESIASLRDEIVRTHGAVDILVNNAGVLIDPEDSGVLGSQIKTFRETLEVNVLGALRMCRTFVPLMVENGYGRVVNVSSRAGQLSDMESGIPAYRLSKTALNALTRTLAAELKGKNVLVNSACPGRVKTAMGGPEATRSVKEGASGVVWLATVPDNGPRGGFFRDRKPIPW